MGLKLEDCLLYAVTDKSWLRGQTLAQQVEAALRGGVTMVQLREKTLSGQALEQEAEEILGLCRQYGVPLLINDDVMLAKKIGADGVHVGQSDMAAAEARSILGNDAIIGVTARTVEQALAAEQAGADYLGSGAVFGTSTKKDARPMDPAYFQQICESVSIPVVAIGGITYDNISRLRGRKMSGFAIVSGIFAAEDIEARTRQLWTEARELCLPGQTERLHGLVQKRRPVVQCITNIVTVNDCANALLAIGASPTMAHHPEEMADFAAVSDALVCNMGATESLEAMMAAGLAGKTDASVLSDKSETSDLSVLSGQTDTSALSGKSDTSVLSGSSVKSDTSETSETSETTAAFGASGAGRPIVIDPVGCASSAFRRRKCLDLIDAVHPACIRGNASEILALATDRNTGRGVDDPAVKNVAAPVSEDSGADRQAGHASTVPGRKYGLDSDSKTSAASTAPGARSGLDSDSKASAAAVPTAKSNAIQAAMELSQRTGAIVTVSGETDYVVSGTRVYEVPGGSAWMSRVTGTGCMLSSLMGAYLAVENSALSAAACCAMMNACAEKAYAETVRREGGTGTFHIAIMDALSGRIQ